MGGDSKSSNSNKAVEYNNLGRSKGGLAGNINQGENASLQIEKVEQTDQGATKEAGKTARKAIEGNSRTAQAGINLAGFLGEKSMDDAADSRDTAEMLFKTGTGAMTDVNRRTLQQMQQSNDRAMAFANKASRSDTTELAQNLTRYGAYAVGGLALAIFLANRGG